MQCNQCKKGDTKVVDSRVGDNSIRRRRECLACGFRFTTHERVEVPEIKVEKRDGRVESYSRDKIEAGVRKALEKRQVEEEEILNLIDDIEQEVINANQKTVSSIYIGEAVSKKLKAIDDVAYLRFVSVYKSFSSAKTFENEAKKLTSKKMTKKLIKSARQ